MKRKDWVAALGLLSAVVVAIVLWPEWPRWRLAGTQSLPAQSVSYRGQGLECPPAGSRIAIFGDSHVAGGRMGGKDGKPFGKVMEAALGNGVAVSLSGVGGHTAKMGEERWAPERIEADTIVIAYGTNDAAPRGWLRGKEPVPIASYKTSLTRWIARGRANASQVILLAPPPAGSAAIMSRLAPYRAAMRQVGQAMQVPVLDPAAAFASCPEKQPVLVRDALHMNADGHRCLGKWLAEKLCPAPG